MATNAEKRDAVLTLASGQLGLFTTIQAVEVGITRDAVKGWARSGRVTSVRPGVWAVRGAPDSPDRTALEAVLGRRHPVSLALDSAGWVWQLPGHSLAPVSLLSVRDRHRPGRSRPHTSTRLASIDITVRRGLPVTTPTRTIFDLAGRQHPARTRRDLNDLMGRGLIRLEGLQHQLERLAGRGRPGITVMRELITRVEDGEQPTESGLELRARDILREAGFTALDQQVVLGDDDGFIARVDFCTRPLHIVFEIDSDRFHGGLLDQMLDAEKTARLEAVGWTVVRITEHEIFWARDALVSRLETVLGQAQRAVDRTANLPVDS
jgi:very-short-patch-repair endonuclease